LDTVRELCEPVMRRGPSVSPVQSAEKRLLELAPAARVPAGFHVRPAILIHDDFDWLLDLRWNAAEQLAVRLTVLAMEHLHVHRGVGREFLAYVRPDDERKPLLRHQRPEREGTAGAIFGLVFLDLAEERRVALVVLFGGFVTALAPTDFLRRRRRSRL